MKEISLNILDIAQNSVKAGAAQIEISLVEKENVLTVVIKDDGCGMSKEVLMQVENPFYTTRTTRSVGLGIPLYKLAAEQTGGSLTIDSIQACDSPDCHGTTVTAVFHTDHLDCMPLGDIISTLCTLIQGAPEIDFIFSHQTEERRVELDTRQVKTILDGVPIDSYEVMEWIRQYLEEQYTSDSE